MTRVERLRKLADIIPVERSATVGGTGYIDDLVHPAARMTKGRDPHGRVFVTLCLRSQGENDRGGTFHGRGVVTVFQRYNNDEDIVTQGSNSRRGVTPHVFMTGAATDEGLTFLEQLVRHGEATRTITDTAGGTLRERLWLIEPEDAVDTWTRKEAT
jgi:hypothetical protein